MSSTTATDRRRCCRRAASIRAYAEKPGPRSEPCREPRRMPEPSRKRFDSDTLQGHGARCGKEQRTVKREDLRKKGSVRHLSILAEGQGPADLVRSGDARSHRPEVYAHKRHSELVGSNPAPLAVSRALTDITALCDYPSVTGVQRWGRTASHIWIVEDDSDVPRSRERLVVRGDG